MGNSVAELRARLVLMLLFLVGRVSLWMLCIILKMLLYWMCVKIKASEQEIISF